MTTAVIGGGISGLTACFYLRKLGIASRIILLEASSKSGGWISSQRTPTGALFEVGPRTLRASGKAGANTIQLVEELGLKNEIISISRGHPTTSNRMIRVGGSLYKLPSSAKAIFKTGTPFLNPLALCLFRDLTAASVVNNDESLFSFISRRFGTEIAHYIIDPLARGIFAGNARDLSVKSVAKELHDAEQEHGSVLLGLAKNWKKRRPREIVDSSVVEKAHREKWAVWSLNGGLRTLVNRMHDVLCENSVEVLNSTEVLEVSYRRKKVHLSTNKGVFEADKVVCCLPAVKLKNIVHTLSNPLVKLLESIPFTTVAVVNLEFGEQLLKEEAFGYLVPSTESNYILGVIFDTCSFPHSGRTVLTIMMGGYWFKSVFGENPSSEHLLKLALEEVSSTLHISQVPVNYKVSILRDCIPQYVVGHSEIVDCSRKLVRDLGLPMLLCGNSFDGVGINDAIYSTKNLLQQIV